MCEDEINLFPAFSLYIYLWAPPQQNTYGTYTQKVLPVIAGSLGAPLLFLRDLLETHGLPV